jgi:ATP-dependent exoDNAse (exonuclease V) beta subunit
MAELLAAALPEVAQAMKGEAGGETQTDEKRDTDEKPQADKEEDYEQGKLCPSEASRQERSTNKLIQKPAKRPVQMYSMHHDIEFRQSNRSTDFIQGVGEEESDSRFINRGRMLHTLFSAIQTAEDIQPAIEQLIFEGVIREENREAVMQVTEKAFSLPEIQEWYSGKWQLFNECAIIYKENGTLQTRRPDRVMMKDGEVVVVDFKFGKENRKYNKQVQGYIRLLERMGYSNISGYLWYVDEEQIEKV